MCSDAGTNLKGGGKAGHQSRSKVGAPIQCEAQEKFFLVVPLHFLALKAELFVLVSAFVMVSTVWSIYYLLFF